LTTYPIQIFTQTTGMTHFLDNIYSTVLLSKCSMAPLYYLINASYFTVLTWPLMVECLCEWRIRKEIKENRNDLLQGKITAFAWRHRKTTKNLSYCKIICNLLNRKLILTIWQQHQVIFLRCVQFCLMPNTVSTAHQRWTFLCLLILVSCIKSWENWSIYHKRWVYKYVHHHQVSCITKLQQPPQDSQASKCSKIL